MSLPDLIERLPDKEALAELLRRPDRLTIDAIASLCDRAIAVSLQRPNDAVQIAEVAVDLSGQLPPFWSREACSAVRSKALRICGACCRLINDLDRAEEALIVSLRHLRLICSDPPIELTETYLQFAALRADQRRHIDALRMARRGVGLSYAAGDLEMIGKALATEGLVSYFVDMPNARRTLSQALSVLSRESDWRFSPLSRISSPYEQEYLKV